jgi:hypothetical protein
VEIPLALLPHAVKPYMGLMILGFGVGILGHIGKNKVMVGIGITMIFLACVLLPLAIIASNPTPEQPAPNAFPPGER